MQETVELFQAVPKLKTKKDKCYAILISFSLSYGYYLSALIVWFLSSWYIALSILLLVYLLTGIISSKLLHYYIPHKQHEFSYSNRDLAAWIIDYYRIKEDTL